MGDQRSLSSAGHLSGVWVVFLGVTVANVVRKLPRYDRQLATETDDVLRAGWWLLPTGLFDIFHARSRTSLPSCRVEMTASSLERIDASVGLHIVQVADDHTSLTDTDTSVATVGSNLGSPGATMIEADFFQRSLCSGHPRKEVRESPLVANNPWAVARDNSGASASEIEHQPRWALCAVEVVVYSQGSKDYGRMTAVGEGSGDVSAQMCLGNSGCFVSGNQRGEICQASRDRPYRFVSLADHFFVETVVSANQRRPEPANDTQAIRVLAPALMVVLMVVNTLITSGVPALIQVQHVYRAFRAHDQVDRLGRIRARRNDIVEVGVA